MKKFIQKGSATPAILIMAAAMIIVLFGILMLLATQLDYSHRQVASEEALNVAEAGINYYKWHLAHAPNDFQDGTGETRSYLHDFLDPQGIATGQYSLEITPPEPGSTVVTIRSTGWTNKYPSIKRTIKAKYGIQSLTQYSFLSNASNWYGAGSIVYGHVHSNNGIRMDGVNTSIVSSSQATYKCGWETGCEPPTWKPGVWGSGGDSALWQFPVPSIDFDLISIDLDNLRTQAQAKGLYLGPTNTTGYHIVFAANGTFQIFKITQTSWVWGYIVPGQGLGEQGEGGCRKRYQIITQESLLGTYNLSNTPIIFLEDNLWVEGEVNGRATIAVATFPISSSKVNIWILNNLTYTKKDGTNTLALISQNNIYFGKNIPDYFTVDAVLMAQKGTILRHGYLSDCGGPEGAVKQKLTINGSLISYYKSYWNFGPGPESGFREQEINYDANLIFNPPPYYPTSGDYQFISWIEE